ncbi:hypothetical protein OR1_03507 [Geobacter sp. OR-1]|uniref:hypothetical protein n=1 Tax=Geobacter sp. OR-1 TaxID=1266765 RepID=UPI000544523C|nr:hypothetical protein [Geobacter sp. OR-1]GAM11197.1 hypothetical protein OR1_03507 [Geobacter sp. OR-1]
MKLFFLFAALVLPFKRKAEVVLPEATSAALVTPELLTRLRRYCVIAVGAQGGERSRGNDLPGEFTADGGNRMDPEELYNAVFFKITDDNCRELRAVSSGTPTNDWLKKIVRTTAIDLLRQERGRIDWDKLGKDARLICRLVITYGYPADEARELLQAHYGIDSSLSEIDRIVEAVRGKARLKADPEGGIDVRQMIDEETGMTEQIFIDNRHDPEQLVASHQETVTRDNTLQLFLTRLKPDDRLLISLNFGLDGQELTLKEISGIMASTETALQKRKLRIIEEFRGWLGKQRLSLDELICHTSARSTT